MKQTWILEIVTGAHAGKKIKLASGRTVIGRHPTCAIVLDAVAVSRQHAAVVIEGTAAWIEDLGSRNGTRVGGRPIAGRRALEPGEEIVIGNQRLVLATDAEGTAPQRGGGSRVPDHGFLEGGPESVIVSQVAMLGKESGTDGNEHSFRAAFDLDKAIGPSVTLEEVLPRTLAGLFEIFPQAQRGFLLLVDPASQRLVLRASRFVDEAQAGRVLFSTSLMERVMQSRQAVLSADVAADSTFDAAGSVVGCGIRSVMCVPFVRDDGAVLGVLQIDRSDLRAQFRHTDLDLLAGVAGAVTRAIEQALAHEERVAQEQLRRDLQLAHQVQQGLLPTRPPEIPGYESFDYYEPARQISGDFFNYVPLSDDRTAIVLADVSGKGVSAALVMATLSADVRYCLASEPDVARAVCRINESLCRSGWEERFATLVVAVLDPRRHRLTVVNAGHMPPLVREADGTVRDVGAGRSGLPLGFEPEHAYAAVEIGVAPGSTLVMYTDGINEAMDHAERTYGLTRLEQVVADAAGGASDVGRRILADVDRHAAGQVRSDDICLVCLARLSPGPRDGPRAA